MDRLEAMKVFVTALDEGSLAGAGRRLGRSPAAVGRAIAFLEHPVFPLPGSTEILVARTCAASRQAFKVRSEKTCADHHTGRIFG